jgi:hypothetical protein
MCKAGSHCASRLDTLFQTGLDEFIQIAVEHFLRIGYFRVGAQALDARVVQHVGADLVAAAYKRIAGSALRLDLSAAHSGVKEALTCRAWRWG